jgi:hypothetical protein
MTPDRPPVSTLKPALTRALRTCVQQHEEENYCSILRKEAEAKDSSFVNDCMPAQLDHIPFKGPHHGCPCCAIIIATKPMLVLRAAI